MSNIQTLVCSHCHHSFDFIPTNNRRKYCTNKCKRLANLTPEGAPSRKRYLASAKGKIVKKRKATKYRQSQIFKAKSQTPEYIERRRHYSKRFRERQRKLRFCLICQDPIIGRQKKFCSDLCKDFNHRIKYPSKINILRRCPQCRQPKHFSGTYCSKHCYLTSPEGIATRKHNEHKRRARFYGAKVETVDPLVVALRDKYKCHICRKRVNMNLDCKDKYSATMDHLVPISLGGDHSYANIRLAHRICNSRKGNRAVNEQLLLFG
jgi:5-methylcytosine-specific restriction endonuclease McrA